MQIADTVECDATQAHVRTRVVAGTRFCESRPAHGSTDQQTADLATGRGDLSVTEDGVRQMDGWILTLDTRGVPCRSGGFPQNHLHRGILN